MAADSAAQDFVIPAVFYPGLIKQASSAQGFVPHGWVIEAQASGDLNGDGIGDLALTMRQNDPKNLIEVAFLQEPFNTNPRILAVAFRNGVAGDYMLKIENHKLIPRRDNPSQDDPFEEGSLRIERGSLKVNLRVFMTAGGWEMSTITYTFRHRNDRFELIGYDRDVIHRASGETKDVSANYLTGKATVAKGHISNDKTKVARKTLPPHPLLTIDQVGDGLEFDPGF
jgi:hypothetical protein